ncbi:MAG: hypothetical protein LBU99_06310 [Spirochaetaceae bacterium]|jgi:hypothetical protein|nr:hypothetical protein [Spirochaetaceae bacterium]
MGKNMYRPLKEVSLHGQKVYIGVIPSYERMGFWGIMEMFLYYRKKTPSGIVILMEEDELNQRFAGLDWKLLFRLIGCDIFHYPCRPLPQNTDTNGAQGIYNMLTQLGKKLKEGSLIFLSSEDGERCRYIISLLRCARRKPAGS